MVDTTLPLFAALVNAEDVRKGSYNIHWLEHWLEILTKPKEVYRKYPCLKQGKYLKNAGTV